MVSNSRLELSPGSIFPSYLSHWIRRRSPQLVYFGCQMRPQKTEKKFPRHSISFARSSNKRILGQKIERKERGKVSARFEAEIGLKKGNEETRKWKEIMQKLRKGHEKVAKYLRRPPQTTLFGGSKYCSIFFFPPKDVKMKTNFKPREEKENKRMKTKSRTHV